MPIEPEETKSQFNATLVDDRTATSGAETTTPRLLPQDRPRLPTLPAAWDYGQSEKETDLDAGKPAGPTRRRVRPEVLLVIVGVAAIVGFGTTQTPKNASSLASTAAQLLAVNGSPSKTLHGLIASSPKATSSAPTPAGAGQPSLAASVLTGQYLHPPARQTQPIKAARQAPSAHLASKSPSVASATPSAQPSQPRAAQAHAAPVQSTPVQSTPVQSTPVQSTPTPSTQAQAAAPQTAPAQAAPAQAAPPQAAPAQAAPPQAAPAASTAASTPAQMGAQALAMIHYPWQRIPGYSIQFLPYSDAPSAGFYGNTTFTWGSPGGVSTLYVFPSESISQLAGITAFEIGHEVDAAYVTPSGGHTTIENALGIHPSSWAPNCDCAEQGFLSGWYSAAFSNYWSPGVGQWSNLAATTGLSGPALSQIQIMP